MLEEKPRSTICRLSAGIATVARAIFASRFRSLRVPRPRSVDSDLRLRVKRNAVQLRIQLTAAAVTPPAEHAARRPAEAADAAAADADVRPLYEC